MMETGDATSHDLVATLLRRISLVDSPGTEVELRSILDVNPHVLDDASECDASRRGGSVRGPLHGVPVVVKDNVEVAGMRATAGSLALDAGVCAGDSPVAVRLRQAGAVILATTNLSEWANIRSSRSTSGWSAVGGLVCNPWALDRSAGGSSSGSGAAVAAALSPLAVGTETDGSITCPAALNGVVGIKPTVGAVSTRGVVPISSSQDSVGAMARCVDDAELLLSVLSGDSAITERSARVVVQEIRIGVARNWFTDHSGVDALALSVIRDAQNLFASVTDSTVPAPSSEVGEDEYTVLMCELFDEMNTYLAHRSNSRVRSLRDVVEFNKQHADTELRFFGQELFEKSLVSGGCSSEVYVNARKRNLEWAHEVCFAPALRDCDVLVAPAYMPAWKSDFSLGHPQAGGAVTSPAAIAGFPIVTIPCGRVDDLPIGLSFVGAAGSEHVLVAAARAVERLIELTPANGWMPTFRQPTRG